MDPYQLLPQSGDTIGQKGGVASFEPLFAQLRGILTVTERQEGVAFLRVAKDLYGIDCLLYLCLNIPRLAGIQQYTHCLYSDGRAMQGLSAKPLSLDIVSCAGLSPEVFRSTQEEAQNLPESKAYIPARQLRRLTLPLGPRAGESAFLGITATANPRQGELEERSLLRELGILGNYFHGHILRINGCNSEADILISAKELDCLKWTAAGKTAWEASVILGISERTVRFHLNMAREKLNCITTTQAVAKAVANQLIHV